MMPSPLTHQKGMIQPLLLLIPIVANLGDHRFPWFASADLAANNPSRSIPNGLSVHMGQFMLFARLTQPYILEL